MLGSRLHTARSVMRAHVRNNVRMASTALAAPKAEPGVLEALFGKSSMPRVPLDLPFPGVPEPREVALKEYPSQITTLENGVRVVSQDSNNPIASLGAFIDAGSRYESPANSGISHFMEFFAFKSTSNRSDFALVRDMLKIGANVCCSTSREHTVFAADALREHVPAVVSTLADVIQNPIFFTGELKEAKELYKQAAKDRSMEAETQVMEAIHAAAYHNNTVGLPMFATAQAIDSFTPDALEQHVRNFYVGNRTVVGGIGVDHAELVALAQKEFGSMARGNDVPLEKAKYTGGDVRLHNAEDPMVHVALAFETASWHSPDLVPMCVLQTMMGGGGSFSAGGPGKGMYSRLYQNVLNQKPWVESANSFNAVFTDSALFGMYGISGPSDAVALVDVLSTEFEKMTGMVEKTELSRAKKQLQSNVRMQLEQRSMMLEDAGRQLMTYGKLQTAAELCAQIEAVTDTDIKRVASSMLKTAPSVAVYGSTGFAPRYESIAKRFG